MPLPKLIPPAPAPMRTDFAEAREDMSTMQDGSAARGAARRAEGNKTSRGLRTSPGSRACAHKLLTNLAERWLRRSTRPPRETVTCPLMVRFPMRVQCECGRDVRLAQSMVGAGSNRTGSSAGSRPSGRSNSPAAGAVLPPGGKQSSKRDRYRSGVAKSSGRYSLAAMTRPAMITGQAIYRLCQYCIEFARLSGGQ